MTKESSAVFGSNIPKLRRMRRNIFQTVFQMDALVRRSLLDDADPGPPLGCGPDRSRCEAASAVRAYIVQFVVGTISAERAFVGAYPRFHCVRRQVLVAIFAVRAELQSHDGLADSICQ